MSQKNLSSLMGSIEEAVKNYHGVHAELTDTAISIYESANKQLVGQVFYRDNAELAIFPTNPQYHSLMDDITDRLEDITGQKLKRTRTYIPVLGEVLDVEDTTN